jgi:hypothetical protein
VRVKNLSSTNFSWWFIFKNYHLSFKNSI